MFATALALTITWLAAAPPPHADPKASPPPPHADPKASPPPPHADPKAGLACLRAAYPETVCSVAGTTLVLCNGQRVPWDDGRGAKPYQEFLEHADLEDMMQQRYRAGIADLTPPGRDFEPGRIRNEAFFRAMYGDSAAAVSGDLVQVAWLPKDGGKTLQVTRKNGVAAALQAVSDELARTMPPAIRKILAKTAGAFMWRKVKGSVRRSNHSYAIAVDVGMGRSDYWDWNKPDAAGRYAYRNRFPIEAVPAFERHGFVWGGKWYHFDTMHFEYRPELLVAPCVDGPSPLVPGLLGPGRP